MARELSESAWIAQVTDLAKTLGWDWNHTYTARVKGRSMTTTTKKGWPDHFFWHERWGRSFFVEFKKESGTLEPHQEKVIESLRRAGLTVFVWRPSDLPDVQVELRRVRVN